MIPNQGLFHALFYGLTGAHAEVPNDKVLQALKVWLILAANRIDDFQEATGMTAADFGKRVLDKQAGPADDNLANICLWLLVLSCKIRVVVFTVNNNELQGFQVLWGRD